MRTAPVVSTVLVVIGLGCGGAPAGGPAKTPPATRSATPVADQRTECASAISHAGKTGRGAEPLSAGDAKFTSAMEVAMTDSCVEAQWPPQAIQCLRTGTSQDELSKCVEQLTPAQNEELSHRLAEAAKAVETSPAP